MKTKNTSRAVEQLHLRENRYARYYLLRIRIERIRVYAIYIQRGEDVALELIGSDERKAEEAFLKAETGELSPQHLYDWASDLREEEKREMILC